MRYALEVLTPPAIEPLSLVEAKAHLRVDSDDDDDLITGLITAVREHVEIWLRRSLITRTLRVTFDCFPDEIWLPRPPLLAVSSIVYIDNSGDSQTLAVDQYQVDTRSAPGRIVPACATIWPTTQTALNAVAVTYAAGYGATAAEVPAGIRAALKLILGGLYEHREDTVTEQVYESQAVDRLLWPHRNCLME